MGLPARNGARRLRRWDAHWYLDVAARGYELRGALASVQSNVAFFPLYPWAVGAVHALLPSAWRGEGSLFLCAVALSNVAALLGLWLLWRVAREVTGEDDVASRTVLYAILFPTGFILSAPYPEALFLLLSVGALLAAVRGRFLLAGLLGLLLALHAGQLWRITGNPLALFHAQSAWGRSLAAPWQTLLHPRDFHAWLGPLEAASVALVAALSAWLLALRETRALGLWALVATFSFAQAVLFLFWSRFFWGA